MGKPQEVEVSAEWLVTKAKEVSDDGPAYGLLQGYPATGFCSVENGGLLLGVSPSEVTEFDPEYYWDVRLFGNLGEWHCWRTPKGWFGRLATKSCEEWNDPVKRWMALWGSRVVSDSDWHLLSENRGARVRVPQSWRRALEDKDLPILLEIWERVEPESETGIAGVVDAMVRGFCHKDGSSKGEGRA
jgi:CRISPR-associated protein (TIGR03984 family)